MKSVFIYRKHAEITHTVNKMIRFVMSNLVENIITVRYTNKSVVYSLKRIYGIIDFIQKHVK